MSAALGGSRSRVVREHLLVVLAGLVILAPCAWLARHGTVSAGERRVFHAINDLPDWLYRVLWIFQQFGNLVVAFVLAVVVALLLRRYRVALAAVAAVALKLVLERALKQVVQRQRPGTSVGEIHARGDVSLQGLAFVSGHSTIVTAMAGLLTPILPRRWKPVPWVIVVMNGLTRIYVGAHNPLDIVGGVGLGLVIAGLLNGLLSLIPARGRSAGPAPGAVPARSGS